MNYSYFLGLDVSKKTVNYCLRHRAEVCAEVCGEGQVDNTPQALERLVSQLRATYDLSPVQLLCCVENTGHYSNPALLLTATAELHVWLEDPFQLSRCLGRRPTKTDQLDARAIAEYADRFSDRHQRYELPQRAHHLLGELHALRCDLKQQQQRLTTRHNERRAFSLYAQTFDNAVLERTVATFQTALESGIKDLEAEILRVVAADAELRQLNELVRSVPGMGPVTGVSVLLETGLFQKVPTARQAAAYAGLVAHRRQSGTAMNYQSRAGYGNQVLKTALHQGAHCLIAKPGPLRDFYRRLRDQGKPYKKAINAVRHKILRWVYACVKSGQLFDKSRHLGLA